MNGGTLCCAPFHHRPRARSPCRNNEIINLERGGQDGTGQGGMEGNYTNYS